MDTLRTAALGIVIGTPLVALVLGKGIGRWLAAASLLSALTLWADVAQTGQPVEQSLGTWLSLQTLTISLGVRCDELALLQVALTSAVVWVVLVRWPESVSLRWLMLAWCGVTVAAVASNLGQMFLGWSLSAWASSELARRRETGAPPFRPVWLVQRVSDGALLAGIGLVWLHFGSLEWSTWTKEALAGQRAELLNSVALCVLIGVIGRCAQLPLSVWLETEAGFAATANRSAVTLSDEMVGLWNVPDGHEVAERLRADPTNRWHATDDDAIPAPVLAWWLCGAFLPVGVGVLLRFEPLFVAASNTRLLAVVVGAFTLTLCSASAAAQNNWPRVLSQLAVGQCGLVLLALNIEQPDRSGLAMCLLLIQSVFFAVLLMASETKGRGRTSGLVVVTALLLSSGLWGRHVVADVVWQAAFPAVTAAADKGSEDNIVLGTTSSSMLPLVVVLICVSELLTGFSLIRAWSLSHRQPPDEKSSPHDSHTWSLWLIVGLVSVIGPVIGNTGKGNILPPLFGAGNLLPLSAAGGVLAWWMYAKPSTLPKTMALALGPFARLSRNRFYWDDLYFLLIVHPVTAVSRWGTWFDEQVWERGRHAARRGFARFAGESLEPLADGSWSVYALTTFGSVAVLAWMLLWLRS